MHVEERSATFEEKGFAHGITMVLARLEPWQWAAVSNKAVRRAAALREGGAVITDYGFELEEFEVLADPDTWAGISEFIFAVELGLVSIKSWTVTAKGVVDALPITVETVSRTFRIKEWREHFLSVMDRDGQRYRAVAAEGNV